MTDLPPLTPPPAAHLHPRIVPWQHALAWYEDAMRLFKRGPATWLTLALITIAAEFALRLVPSLGPLLAEIIVAARRLRPDLRGGLRRSRRTAGARQCDQGVSRSRWARWPRSSRPRSSRSRAESFAAWWIAGTNLLDPAGSAGTFELPVLIGIYAIGILASLPVMFVPFHVLLEPVAPGAAFAASWHAFALNTIPLLTYAAASLVLARLRSR